MGPMSLYSLFTFLMTSPSSGILTSLTSEVNSLVAQRSQVLWHG